MKRTYRPLLLFVLGISSLPLAAQPPPKDDKAKDKAGPRKSPTASGRIRCRKRACPRGSSRGRPNSRVKFLTAPCGNIGSMCRRNTSPISRRACLSFRTGSGRPIRAGRAAVPNVLDNLIHKKEMPVTIGIFVTPGQQGRRVPRRRSARATRTTAAVEYDSLGDRYARFIVDEILPEVGKKYKLTKDPEGRAIGGASSAAASARSPSRGRRPDEFRNVISPIGSFTNLRGGHVYPDLVRKAEKKPIRVFLQDGIRHPRPE